MTAVKMPQLGETVIEGTILKWLKQEGDQVALDEPLFEISTDKVDTEVPSSVAGTLTRIIVSEGETVAVGTELAEIDGAGSEAGSAGAGGAAAPGTPSQPAEEPTHAGEAAAPGAPSQPAAAPSATAPAAADRHRGGRRGSLAPRPPRRRRPRLQPFLVQRRCGGAGAAGRRSCRRSCGSWRPSTRSTSVRSPGRGPVDGSRRTTC